MILPEKGDPTTPSSSSLSPAPHAPGYYSSSTYTPSSSGSGASASLRPPPRWHAMNSSETALGLVASRPPPSPSHSHSHSQSYLPLPTKREAPSLMRIPPPDLPRTPFHPMFLFAEENRLEKGFASTFPPSSNHPHPFTISDVNETDWLQFLAEIRIVANLTEKDVDTAYHVPVVSAIPLINLAVAFAITHHIKRKKPRLVSLLIDKWNHHFFHPRNIEIILMRGQIKISGQSDQPVGNLYIPRTVNFKAPPMDDSDGDGKHSSKSSDKTYRLFVVSMAA
ncbi:hypothetical protein MSAN_01630400 [Mycena sanguinolenta]|uniref:Uncharacterized protein n=1 Tax=Mycena sanguinolenta TaxID=230812 RepID=A0A8H7CWL0_9AGAR|nr:hypothetical protein MSAN_01630400 [Mycena sanguinolenta]